MNIGSGYGNDHADFACQSSSGHALNVSGREMTAFIAGLKRDDVTKLLRTCAPTSAPGAGAPSRGARGTETTSCLSGERELQLGYLLTARRTSS